jgi:small subunit ribosomal protein S17
MSEVKVTKFNRKLQGVVVSSTNDKSVIVKVARRYKHPKYSKFVTASKKYHAHDENNTANVGDVVTIMESKPYSKLKKWVLLTK